MSASIKSLITAYAINPYKGSEDGTAWNILIQVAKENRIVAITRENNQDAIEQYLTENDIPSAQNIQFEYFDLPYWMRFWKRKEKGALLYAYLWQIGIVFFIWKRKFQFDVAHHLNFHCDWMPTFLWIFGKPFVWGPVGHHPKIEKAFILQTGGWKALLQDRIKWYVKKFFWTFDPFLKITKWKASKILCINSSVEKVLNLPKEKVVLLPAIATEEAAILPKSSQQFELLSIGRFVHLKGFDLTIRAFAQFYEQQNPSIQANLKLTLIGKGPLKNQLQNLVQQLNIGNAVAFVYWVNRSELNTYFSNADVFLFPSHEGAGMVVPEALSFGLPVVCLDNIGPGESIDENSGIKIPISDYLTTIKNLSIAIDKLYHHEAFRTKLSKGAKERFETYFTWHRKGSIISKNYQEIDKSRFQKASKKYKSSLA